MGPKSGALIGRLGIAALVVLLAGEAASAAPAADSAAGGWIFSETQSPLDYAPVTIASAWSNADAEGRAMQLSIQCRRGRTDLLILSPALAGRPEQARVSYAVDGAPALPLAAAAAPSGSGIAIRGDVVRLLGGLPARGDLEFHVAQPQGPSLDGHYGLAALRPVLDRLAGPCKWPPRTP